MSLELGEAFAASLDRLTAATVAAAEAEYARVEPNEDGELQPAMVVLIARMAELVEVAARAAGDLANGYLQALGDEAGQTIRTVPAPVLDPFGRTAGEVLGSIPGKVYLALSQGSPLEEALPIGGRAMSSIAETWTRDAARMVIGGGSDASEGIVGWKWVSRGTCGACLALDTDELRSGTMDTHPNCQCVPEPFVPPAPTEELSPSETMQLWEKGRVEWRPTLPLEAVETLTQPPAARSQAQRFLRGQGWTGDVFDSELELREYIAGMDELTAGASSYTLPENVAAYRVIDGDALELLEGLREGAVFGDAGFTHVTVNGNIAQNILRGGLGAGGGSVSFVAEQTGTTMLRVHLPAGQRAAIGFSDMEEYVLPRGMTFRVRGRTSVETLDGPLEIIEVDVVPRV